MVNSDTQQISIYIYVVLNKVQFFSQTLLSLLEAHKMLGLKLSYYADVASSKNLDSLDHHDLSRIIRQ